jgi:disulfide oxidoreductase YuzD
MKKIKWLDIPEEKDYAAVVDYLSLHFSNWRIQRAIKRLKKYPVKEFKAKDIFRSSELSLLGVSNSHVKKDQKKIKNGEKLSPILIVKHKNIPVIADGYHRLCAIYSYDEDALIRCKIAEL